MQPPGNEEKKKKKIKRSVVHGVVHIQSTFNNTIISITDQKGEVLSWASGGTVGLKDSKFTGTKKSTPFAAQKASELAAEKAKKYGLQQVDVKILGPGPGRDAAVRALQVAGLNILSIEDLTPIPHNGCRARKKRSV